MQELEVIGQGMTATVYRDGDKAIKLYKNVPFEEVVSEAERQKFAYSAGLPVPKIYDVRKIDESTVALDMEYISGSPLIGQKMGRDERNNAIVTLVKLQCQVHKVHAVGLPKLTDRLKRKIGKTQYLKETQKNELLALTDSLDDGSDYLCHGDFHTQNILYDGQNYLIIDWVDACAGDRLADACRTYLIFRQYISRSAGIYLRAFCKAANVKQEDVLSWLPVIAAARLDENMDDKARKGLLDMIKEAESQSFDSVN